MNSQPIGLFDSGVGGTSIWKEIQQLLPLESTIYLADSKYAPYGERSKEEIIALSIKNTERLLKDKAKIIVVACNTATTNAIASLRERYDVPFVGIEPAIKPAALQTKTKVVGVLATKGTLTSSLFATTSEKYTQSLKMIEVIGTGLVELIERNKIDSGQMQDLLVSYINPMLEQNIDHLVLGCSHYPYLIPILRKILPPNVQIIDSGAAVAKQTKQLLSQHQILAPLSHKPTHNFYINAPDKTLRQILQNVENSYTIVQQDF